LLVTPESLEFLPHGGLPVEPLAKLLARAFVDNPLVVAVVGETEKRRYRSGLYGMRSLLETAEGQAAVLVVRAAGETRPRGVLVGVAPGRYPLPPPPFLTQLQTVLGQGPRIVGRWSRVYDRLQEVHPVVPHWYLGTLGVDPDSQRQGYGAALLTHWLLSVDEAGQPSYLETDRERNVAFYARAGFEVSDEISVLGARVWCMWRAPARQTHDAS
jgi:ribosomal protein S18 acetylase RimI-like enzyme